MIVLQFSALVPVLIILVYKPTLNLFFKLLFASILLSILFDIIGTTSTYFYKNNISIYCAYFFISSILVTYMWKRISFYPSSAKRLINIVGCIIVTLMVFVSLFFKMTIETFYTNSCLSVLLYLIFALQYYYQKITISLYTPILEDPYFIAASGYILFSLSTIIILAVQIHFKEKPFMEYTWVLRQTFYMIFNLIIAYAFYVFNKTQLNRK